MQVQIVYYHVRVAKTLSRSQISLLFLSPEDPNVSLPYLQNVDGKLVLKESDKYLLNVKCKWELLAVSYAIFSLDA